MSTEQTTPVQGAALQEPSGAVLRRSARSEHDHDVETQYEKQVSKRTQKVALITGVTGQDGSYLAEFLISKGYQVHGIIRRSSSFNTGRLDALYEDPHIDNRHLILHYGDLTDSSRLVNLIANIKPDEIYNLGAQSHVKVSFQMPVYTAEVDGVGTLRLLDAIVAVGLEKTCRFYQASTSELYGTHGEEAKKRIKQHEETRFYPRSPYAVAKQFGYSITVNYREAFGIHATNGVLFNHESPRRGPTFVTRKITRAVARISLGLQDVLYLGNLTSERDWGHARDYVKAMWMMLQADEPGDYVVATGEAHSVREFVEIAFGIVNVKIKWVKDASVVGGEYGVDESTNVTRVKIDPAYFRPTEVDYLCGDPAKAKKKFGWVPDTSFQALVQEMVQSDVALVKKGDLIS
eukprot:TRINITY_DN591_c0_g1_i1.p1 TRINITY_DN591_c0_g1~~TRINITY_DN591_c0_g1_i1.p1  ORF type:complete len:423 (-),score=75.08 TRINITY_DN591_c0_g1_i1:58-1272(-)